MGVCVLGGQGRGHIGSSEVDIMAGIYRLLNMLVVHGSYPP